MKANQQAPDGKGKDGESTLDLSISDIQMFDIENHDLPDVGGGCVVGDVKPGDHAGEWIITPVSGCCSCCCSA